MPNCDALAQTLAPSGGMLIDVPRCSFFHRRCVSNMAENGNPGNAYADALARARQVKFYVLFC